MAHDLRTQAQSASPMGSSAFGVRPEFKRVERAENPHIISLLEFYKRHRRADGLLPRRLIPCRELMPLLQNLYLIEPVDATGRDWRFRLAGTAIRHRFGIEVTGKLVRDIYTEDSVERPTERYREVAFGREVHILRGRFLGGGREFFDVELLEFPVEGPIEGCETVAGALFVADEAENPA